MTLSPREAKFLINGAAGVLLSVVQAATLAGSFAELGVWGGLLSNVLTGFCTLVVGWMNLRIPESMRPPPMPPQVPHGKDLRGP